ncbi:MAG: ferrochelatase [Myxococcota bacterium]
MAEFEAILYLSFGGPEGPDEVIPFLQDVTRGKSIPLERLREVGQHYDHFGGKSPINEQNRAFIDALKPALHAAGVFLPVYFANLHSKPFLSAVFDEMEADGIKRVLCYVTSAFGSYAGCRKYTDAIEGGCPASIEVQKIRLFFNHPGFVEAMIDQVDEALSSYGERRAQVRLVFTAHSIPESMAATGPYVDQLREACRLVAEGAGHSAWDLVYQSRSGPPHIPWLEPDIADHLKTLEGCPAVCVAPIGFLSDHVEVLWDLDTEARECAAELGIEFVRAKTVGTHPKFVEGVVALILERLREGTQPRLALGRSGPASDRCAPDCCPAPRRPKPVS